VIVVDSSALLAYLQQEAGYEKLRDLLSRRGELRMSPVNVVEARMVAEGRGLGADLAGLMSRAAIELVPTDTAQAEAAWDAFKRFGKGRHAAALNLADCFAYALAQVSEAPLLYIGADFAKTDVRSALA
jgi:ribonuclease VapC